MRENVLKHFRKFLFTQQEVADTGGYPCKAMGFVKVAQWFALLLKGFLWLPSSKIKPIPEAILDHLHTRLIQESGHAKICIDAATTPDQYTRYYWYREAYNEVLEWIRKEKLEKGDAKWIGGM